jgi:8-oxo-dGTP pyrophosphatase MutT (NUDIX family)
MSWQRRLSRALDPDLKVPLNDERAYSPNLENHQPAAVLIAVTDRPEPGVILTQRPDWLRSHAGQVAFPGGKIDANDKNEIGAALREADEELGLHPDDVTILGVSDIYYTSSGYRITPVVGMISPDTAMRANPDEVVDWFEVPLGYLLDLSNAKVESAMWEGQMRQYYDIRWQNRRIWGVTAGIIANLAHRVHAA